MEDFIDQYNYLERILSITATYTAQEELMWNEDLDFYVICNDLFSWGVADFEWINSDDLDLLERSLKDAGYVDGLELFCCRKRGMRPQNAVYKYLKEENRKFFDACGLEREISFDNPAIRKSDEDKKVDKSSHIIANDGTAQPISKSVGEW